MGVTTSKDVASANKELEDTWSLASKTPESG